MIAIEIDKVIKLYPSLPKIWKNIINYDKVEKEIWYNDGFREIIQPEFDKETQQRTNKLVLLKGEFDYYSYLVEDKEIIENIIQVPVELPLWKLRVTLKIMDLIQTIENIFNELPEPNRTAALAIWEYGNSVDRYSETVLFLQKQLDLTDKQVDDIFINSEKIIL